MEDLFAIIGVFLILGLTIYALGWILNPLKRVFYQKKPDQLKYTGSPMMATGPKKPKKAKQSKPISPIDYYSNPGTYEYGKYIKPGTTQQKNYDGLQRIGFCPSCESFVQAPNDGSPIGKNICSSCGRRGLLSRRP
jgi:hypothetical protein